MPEQKTIRRQKCILFFRKGEYLDNSDFGVGLQDYLFDQYHLLDLPPDLDEVAENIIYSPQSVVFDEAENRLHAQKALLVDIMGGSEILMPDLR